MSINELRLYLNTILNKDASGNSLSPQELNLLLEACIFPFVREKIAAYRQYVMNGTPMDDVAYTGLLIDSLTKQSTATLAAGAFTVAADFMMMNDLYGTYNGQKKIEMVSPEEYSRRTHNILSKPIAYYPVAYLINTSCKVFPTTMTAINYTYISKPAVPIFDYYTNANYQIVYLAAGATRALAAGEYGSLGQTSVTVTSLTAELDLPEEIHGQFADYLLSKIALRDRDINLYQANQAEKGAQV